MNITSIKIILYNIIHYQLRNIKNLFKIDTLLFEGQLLEIEKCVTFITKLNSILPTSHMQKIND